MESYIIIIIPQSRIKRESVSYHALNAWPQNDAI